MIKNYNNLPIRSFTYSALLSLGLSLCFNVSPAMAQDPLEESSVKSPLVNYSLLLDIDRVGNKLIAVGERGHILISEDEAKSWSQVDVPVRVTLTGSFFINEQIGWAIGQEGVVLRTKDGGQHWTKLLDGHQANTLILDAAKHELTTAELALENIKDESQIEDLEYAVENADMFFSDAESFVEEGATRPFLGVWFKNELEGFITGGFGFFLKTVDGGDSWIPWFAHIDNPDLFHLNAINPIHGKLFISAEAGSLYRSDDQGQSWTLLESPYEGSFFGIAALGEHGIIAYGLRGNAYVSYDDGENWAKVDTGVDTSLFASASLADGTTVVVGSGGVMLFIDTSGKLVKTMRHPNKFPISGVLTGTNDDLYTVGFGGVRKIEELSKQLMAQE